MANAQPQQGSPLPSQPQQQQQGSAPPPQQQQGGKTVFKDWAAI
ncbi:hypothetical protein [Pseudogemmobacter sonorensis]